MAAASSAPHKSAGAENDINVKFAEESNALMANGRQQKAPEKTSFATFIFNKREGTFLGRGPKSWSQILFFYVIFYSLLAAFWLACLYIFLQTIDDDLPRYYGPDTIIGANPGVGYQPWIRDDPESTLIMLNPSDPSSYKKYVQSMNEYLKKYANTTNTRECTGTQSNADIVRGGKLIEKENAKSCKFDLSIFELNECGASNDYGFKDGKPCVLLSLNRLIGWKPDPYIKEEYPPEVRARYQPDSIAFSCDGIGESDKENIGHVKYVPPAGIDGRYFPFAVMPNYHQPIAMVKFMSLPKNRVVMVECRAFAKNIEHDNENRIGMVTFELLLQDSVSGGAAGAKPASKKNL